MRIGDCIQIGAQVFRCMSAEFGPDPGEITFHLVCRDGEVIQMLNVTVFNTEEPDNESDQ